MPVEGEEDPDLAQFAPGKIGGKTFDEWPKWDADGVPLFENCDPKNPRQAFLPFFTAMPGIKGAPLIMTVDYWELQSWRMWLLGAKPTGGKRKLKYRPPASMTNAWTAQGEYVDISELDAPRKTLRELTRELPQNDRAGLKQMFLEELGLEGDTSVPMPDGKFRADDLARRLDIPLQDLSVVLGRFGVRVDAPGDLVDRAVADRIMAHLGL